MIDSGKNKNITLTNYISALKIRGFDKLTSECNEQLNNYVKDNLNLDSELKKIDTSRIDDMKDMLQFAIEMNKRTVNGQPILSKENL